MYEHFEWDEAKNAANIRKHGIGFDRVSAVDWATAQFFSDDRMDYGEDRVAARIMIDGRLHMLVFVLRDEKMRVISLRKANPRERRAYHAETGRIPRTP